MMRFIRKDALQVASGLLVCTEMNFYKSYTSYN